MTKQKKKLEFSQKWLIGWGIVTIFFCLLSFAWSALGFDALESLTISIVQVIGIVDAASFSGYVVQNSIRASSANKYGYTKVDTSVEDSDETPISSCENKK